MNKLIAVGLTLLAAAALIFFIPTRGEAVQNPGGGQMAICYTCTADTDGEGFVGAYYFWAQAVPILDGKCAKQAGPSAPCDIPAVSCLWEVTGDVVVPPGWVVVPTSEDTLSGGIQVAGSNGSYSIGGILVAPCGESATVTFTIKSQAGGVEGMHMLSVGCDSCPG